MLVDYVPAGFLDAVRHDVAFTGDEEERMAADPASLHEPVQNVSLVVN